MSALAGLTVLLLNTFLKSISPTWQLALYVLVVPFFVLYLSRKLHTTTDKHEVCLGVEVVSREVGSSEPRYAQ